MKWTHTVPIIPAIYGTAAGYNQPYTVKQWTAEELEEARTTGEVCLWYGPWLVPPPTMRPDIARVHGGYTQQNWVVVNKERKIVHSAHNKGDAWKWKASQLGNEADAMVILRRSAVPLELWEEWKATGNVRGPGRPRDYVLPEDVPLSTESDYLNDNSPENWNPKPKKEKV